MTELLPDERPRDIRVLVAVVRMFKAEPQPIPARRIAEALDLSEDEVLASYRNLELGRYVYGGRDERTISHHVFGITERALYETGVWRVPETAFDRIVSALERLSTERGPDQERASSALDALSGAGGAFRRALGAAALDQGVQ